MACGGGSLRGNGQKSDLRRPEEIMNLPRGNIVLFDAPVSQTRTNHSMHMGPSSTNHMTSISSTSTPLVSHHCQPLAEINANLASPSLPLSPALNNSCNRERKDELGSTRPQSAAMVALPSCDATSAPPAVYYRIAHTLLKNVQRHHIFLCNLLLSLGRSYIMGGCANSYICIRFLHSPHTPAGGGLCRSLALDRIEVCIRTHRSCLYDVN